VQSRIRNSTPPEARSGERGQVLVLALIFIVVVLLGIAAFVIDVGYAYYAHRSLQSQADAAALAGAQELPDATKAQNVANSYGGQPGGKNANPNIPGIQTTVVTKCITSIPGCDPVNAVVVTERAAKVPTIFAKLLGIDHFDIRVKSTACSPCGTKPLDIMLVLDRTGSMCQDHNGNPDPGCTDLNNAKTGMKTFLGYMDPALQHVGLAVLPPASSVSNRCAQPTAANYNNKNSPYVIVPLSSDYIKNGALNTNSDLVKTINCVQANDRTAYANAIEAAQAELTGPHGMADAPNIMVFLSDGAANIGPTYYASNSPYRMQPCHQGVWSAATVKNSGTLIYSIGYDLNAQNGGANICTDYNGNNEKPSITAYSAISQIASRADTFYNQPNPGQLKTIFSQIAADLGHGTSALIDNDTQ
jgi:hypothetical protein